MSPLTAARRIAAALNHEGDELMNVDTRIPVPRSETAEAFFAEHDHAKREVIVLRDENTALKADLDQSRNMIELLVTEGDRLRAEIANERARGNVWLTHAIRLLAEFGAVEAVIAKAKTVAEVAAAEAARVNLVENVEAKAKDHVDTAKLVESLSTARGDPNVNADVTGDMERRVPRPVRDDNPTKKWLPTEVNE